MNKKNNFEARLQLGNQKEEYVCDILNLIGLECKQNNLINVTNIDLILENYNILIDVKYVNTPFRNSLRLVGIETQNCLPITKKYIKKYLEEQQDKEAWICFYIKFDEYNINELKFIPVEKLNYLNNKNTNYVNYNILNIDKNECYSTFEFLNYCKAKREFLNTKNKYNFN